MTYEERSYRKQIKPEGLHKFSVEDKETDLLILSSKSSQRQAHAAVLKFRADLENYIVKDPKFLKAMRPHRVSLRAPKIVKEMASASKRAKVGPMATVAGAIAEYVGRSLAQNSKEVMVENGGDIFMKTKKPRKIAIYAGNSPFSEKIAIEIDPDQTPVGVCTSAGTVGHSTSFGAADAVVVISKSTALADAAATAIGNAVKTVADIEGGLNMAKRIKGLKGVLIIKDDHIGAWGRMKIVAI
jgi:ApbE superfamily uncharacterized protein (UPF0280 family)